VGQPKAVVAAAAVKKFNPAVDIVAHHADIKVHPPGIEFAVSVEADLVRDRVASLVSTFSARSMWSSTLWTMSERESM
jgi:molybdopterin/thiamine biosynthesis adenylyltransferase